MGLGAFTFALGPTNGYGGQGAMAGEM